MRIAWQQALASIRVRRGRHAITGTGIALGIAFFAAMRLLMSVEGSSEKNTWLLATSLLMCFVGITNSMLMSVVERYREIGTLKCLGASDGLIVAIFLLEALLVGVFASFIGAVSGEIVMSVVVRFMEDHAKGGSALWEATGIGALMTLLASVVPAVQAARMPATAALRVEV